MLMYWFIELWTGDAEAALALSISKLIGIVDFKRQEGLNSCNMLLSSCGKWSVGGKADYLHTQSTFYVSD